MKVLFSDAQGQLTLLSVMGFDRKLKLIHTLMHVLVSYKDEENQMKNEGARVVKTLYSYILDAQGKITLYLVVGCGRKLIQTFMSVLVTCKNEEDPFKNEGARVVTTNLPL